MRRSKIQIVASIAVIILLLFGVFATLAIDSDFGKIETTIVAIKDDNKELSGLLYRPKSATTQNPAPAVLVAHGISGSKEMMSSIGLELARKDFVALCLDLLGHGKSQGSVEEGTVDRSFGVYSALQYLKSQPYVNSSSLGLVGHSLGAGAVRATVAREPQVGATILVAGGLGNTAEEPEYGVFNSTYPRNLLVIVGKYDVLFDVKKLTSEELPAAFDTQQEILPGVLYGEFAANTARKLVLPSTTHLFEPMDPTTIAETVAWIEDSLGKRQNPASLLNPRLIYVQREAAILLALAGLVGITVLSFSPINKLIHSASERETPKDDKATSLKWRLYAFWASVNLVLLFPMSAVGSAIAFPPLIFGASIAWWMMASGSVGLLGLAKFSGRILGKTFSLKQTLKDNFSKKEAVGSVISFALIFTIATILADGFNFTFRIISPIFRDLTAARALVFPTFIPFFFLYFTAEGLLLHDLPRHSSDTSRKQIRNYAETLIGKTLPFAVLLVIHYSGKILFDFWILPGFAGFLMEFLWLILPIFVITTSISWWFHKSTKRIFYGALLNALLMSWVASVVFPF
jgi:dienelactone hydrolase